MEMYSCCIKCNDYAMQSSMVPACKCDEHPDNCSDDIGLMCMDCADKPQKKCYMCKYKFEECMRNLEARASAANELRDSGERISIL